MKEHLISIDGFRELARPTSAHLDVEEVNKYIEECEDIYIIPAVGLETFKALLDADVCQGMPEDVLLNGGEWIDEKGECGCDGGKLRKCHGLRKALSYFVYARMMQNDGGIVTRTGFVKHNDEYASRDDDKNRVRKYNEVMSVAETYLSTSVDYWKCYKGDCRRDRVRGTRIRIHSVGD